MKNSRSIVFLTALVVAACNQQQSSESGASSADSNKSSPNQPNAANGKSGWALSEENSLMDGKSEVATRTFDSPDSTNHMQVEVKCFPSNKFVGLYITSLAGDNDKNPDSAFLQPYGRVRYAFSDKEPTINLLQRSGTYSNQLFWEYSQKNDPNQSQICKVFIPDTDSDDFGKMQAAYAECINHIWNGAFFLKSAMPITLQLRNGAGQVEFQIAASDEISKALAPCGGDGPASVPDPSRQPKPAVAATGGVAAPASVATQATPKMPMTQLGDEFVDGDGTRYGFEPSFHAGLFKSDKILLVINADCSAREQVRGKGSWSWSDDGFSISFPTGETFEFPRQHVNVAQGDACRAQ